MHVYHIHKVKEIGNKLKKKVHKYSLCTVYNVHTLEEGVAGWPGTEYCGRKLVKLAAAAAGEKPGSAPLAPNPAGNCAICAASTRQILYIFFIYSKYIIIYIKETHFYHLTLSKQAAST